MKIALLQAAAKPLAPKHNLALIDDAAARARSAGAEVLLTPELFVFSYAPARIRQEVTARDVVEARQSLETIARSHGIGLVVSLPGEERPSRRGIMAILLGASGERLAEYQKVQLFGPEEKSSFAPGDKRPPVVDYGALRVGLLVCYDIEFPELARAVAGSGAELLLVPTALSGDVPAVPGTLIPARSLENCLTIAYANHVGSAADGSYFYGRSIAAGPNGEILGELGGEPGLLVVDVPRRSAPGSEGPWYLEDRRAELHRQWL